MMFLFPRCLCSTVLFFSSLSIQISALETIFGEDTAPSQIVIDILETQAMQRLKEIDQSGITKYFHDLPPFTRYDHSIGVYYLLKRFGATEKECIAGLLHDASHTVFSHVGDLVFRHQGEEGYQDSIHLWYLDRQGIAQTIEPLGWSLFDIDPKNDTFKRLEQDLPDMCADRIEYNLHTALLFNYLPLSEILEIVDDLDFASEKWFFESPLIARRFAEIPLYFTDHLWCDEKNLLAYHWAAETLLRALSLQLISVEEIHFSNDRYVLNKLLNSSDPLIQDLMAKVKSPLDFVESCEDNGDFILKGKFRGIDPLIKVGEDLKRLSEIDEDFKLKFESVRRQVKKGIRFQFTEDSLRCKEIAL